MEAKREADNVLLFMRSEGYIQLKSDSTITSADLYAIYTKTYKELTAENTELEKELNSASRESIQKKLEIQRKLSELDELRRTVDAIPAEVIRAYTAQKYVHHGRMNQEI